jgi:phage baseplate assembly protein W
MPNDIAIIAPLVKIGKSPDFLRATGNTEFIFEPYENDIQFNRSKALVLVSGTDKLIQSIMRVILTHLGDSFEDAKWGSALDSQIGSKMANDNYAVVRESIIQALIHYNDVNQDNPNSDEVIKTIDELAVVQDLNDPRVIRVVVGVTSESGNGVRVIVPQVIN